MKLEVESDAFLERHTWRSIRECVKNINVELTAIIDEIDPSDDYAFYIAKYPYGAMIVDKGVFQVVGSDGCLVPLNHSNMANIVKTDLGYNKTIPTGMILKNSIETFFLHKSRTVSSSLYGAGDMVALWHVLEGVRTYQAGPIWNISSGARTIYMLPKITDKNSYRVLKDKYHLKTDSKALADHWHIFSHLANHSSFPQKWHSEILFFSRKWFEKMHDKAFSQLFKFFLNNVWLSSLFRRNQSVFDFAFSVALENRNLKPNPYLADTLKHLIVIGDGFIPGLVPACNNLSAPIGGLQQVFLEDYGLKKYAPIIMHLHHFSIKESRPVYYSLEVPTTTAFSPRSSRSTSKMEDMRELKHITKILLSEIIKGTLYVEETPLRELAENVKYQFYHSDKDYLNEVSEIIVLAEKDKAFTKTLIDSKTYNFPEFSPIFRGCISISALE